MKRILFSAATFSFLIFTGSALAQESHTSGLFLSASVVGSAFSDDANFRAQGLGAGFTIGYGITSSWSLTSSIDGVVLKDRTDTKLTGALVDLGVRYTFGSSEGQLRPYLGVARSGKGLEDSSDENIVQLFGTGFSGIAGMQNFFEPNVSVFIEFKYTGGGVSEFRWAGERIPIEGESSLAASAVRVGLSWYPIIK